MIKLSGGLVVLGAAVAVALTGCTPQQAGTVSAPPSGAAAKATEKPAAATTAKVGGSVTYPDGVAVTVLSMGRYSSEAVARRHPGAIGVKVVVRITNGTTAPLGLDDVAGNMHSGPNGTEADSLFDTANNVGAFSGTIAPGRVASASLGFVVLPADVGQASLDITVGSRAPALFDGTVK